MYPPSIQKLIEIFSNFPTIGSRTATRFVFYLLKLPQEEFENFLTSLKEIKETTKICPSCFNCFTSNEDLCPICKDNSRDKSLLCIVEKEADLESLEKAQTYQGLYFILGGTVNLKKMNIRIKELKEKISNGNFQEIVIATNPTPEGETTALYLERELKSFNIKTTRLGCGLPVGGELEYADEDTLKNALQHRK